MTVRSNKQIVLDYLAALYSGDIETAVADMSHDIEFLVPAPVEFFPHLGLRHGRVQVQSMLTTIRQRYPNARYEVHSAIAQDDCVATHVRVMFHKSGRDRVVQLDVADFFSFKDGKIVAVKHFVDSFDLIQQALEVDLTAILLHR